MSEEIIIDNLDDEDYEDIKLFEYKLSFDNANAEQQSYIEEVFDDWSWSMGLNIAHLKKVTENQLIAYIFQSPISFEDKDIENWSQALKNRLVAENKETNGGDVDEEFLARSTPLPLPSNENLEQHTRNHLRQLNPYQMLAAKRILNDAEILMASEGKSNTVSLHVILGGPGNGKSRTVVALSNCMVDRGMSLVSTATTNQVTTLIALITLMSL